tara:strand:+ start:75 stop:1322 length:1248 start_codon:yes stop_codon:yes gene_type:complete
MNKTNKIGVSSNETYADEFFTNIDEPKKSSGINDIETKKEHVHYSECEFMKKNKLKNLITIDCGSDGNHYFDHTQFKESKKISHGDLLKLPYKYKNTVLVSEIAHFDRPRTMQSFAQPFTKEELIQFKDACVKNNNHLRLFPERQTPKACAFAENEKSDELDPISIFKYLNKYPHLINSLKKPSETYEPSLLQMEGWKFKNNMNQFLNYARRNNYGKSSKNDPIRNFILIHLNEILSNVDENAITSFNLNSKIEDKINWTGVFSVVSPMFEFSMNEDFNVSYKYKLREFTNNPAGWRFVSKHVFEFTPNHGRGGTARSNLKFHNFRTFMRLNAEKYGLHFPSKGRKLSGKDKFDFDEKENHFFKHMQKLHKNACKQLYIATKNIISKILDDDQNANDNLNNSNMLPFNAQQFLEY